MLPGRRDQQQARAAREWLQSLRGRLDGSRRGRTAVLVGLLALGAAVLIHGLGDKNSLLTVIGAGDAALAVLFLLAEPFVRWWSGNLLARAAKAEAASAPGQLPDS